MTLILKYLTEEQLMEWSGSLRSHAQLILDKLREYLAYSSSSLLQRLIEGGRKIHQQRPLLQEQLATILQSTVEA